MPEPMGFFTDTTVCIGCKACEVACKQWNQLPATNGGRNTLSGDSYDNTRRLDGEHWRHVKFIEQFPEDRKDGRAWKCTLCYDRIGDGMEPACAKACPTDSIQFGPVKELRTRAEKRVQQLHATGEKRAQLYGADEKMLGGLNSFFLLVDRPEVYHLPPDPKLPSRNLAAGSLFSALGALLVALIGVVNFRNRTRP